MKISPVEHKYGKPKPKPISFGIYKGSKVRSYGSYHWGEYKDKKIEIYDAYKFKQKLIYVSDICKNFIKSKLTYFENGTKKVTRSERK